MTSTWLAGTLPRSQAFAPPSSTSGAPSAPPAPPLASTPARQTPCSQRWAGEMTVQSASPTQETSQTPGASSAMQPGTHCAAGNVKHPERSAQGKVHTPHTHVSRSPQVLAFDSQRVKKWVSPPVGSPICGLQLKAKASAAIRIVSRRLPLLSMIFAITVFMYQALARIDDDSGMRLGQRPLTVEFHHALSHVGEHAAQSSERAEYLVFQRMPGPDVDRVGAATHAIVEGGRSIFVQTAEDGRDQRLEVIEHGRLPTHRGTDRNDERASAV